jgi:lysophospholipase L1-like esterase
VAIAVTVWVVRGRSLGDVANTASPGSAIIAFGDSITAGYGAGAGEDYPSQLSRMAAVDVINAGVSGDTTESALARIDESVLRRDPRIVIVGLGGNDYLRHVPMSATEANLRVIVDRIQGAGAMVVLLGFRFPSLNANYEAMYERVAEEKGCLLVEDVLDGILADSKLKSDEIHPNAAGYALIAERVSGPLRDLVDYADGKR